MSLRTRLLLALAYVTLLAIVALGVPLALNLRNRVDAEVRSQARSQADVVAATASDLLDRGSRARLRRLTTTAAASVSGRVLVVDNSGRVLADSAGSNEVGSDYSPRPEIAAALRGDAFQRVRHSDTLNTDILATSVPVLRAGRPDGAVRVTQSVNSVHRAVRRTLGGLGLIAGVVLLLGLAAGIVLARQIARPMRRLTDAAQQIAGGDLDVRAPVEGSAEQRSLARSFNEMTEKLSRSLASEKRFVADASHQLRTPLTGLRLRLEEASVAESREQAEPDLQEGLREVDRLAGMVDELLALSRAQNGQGAGRELDPAVVADEGVARWRAAADEHGMALVRGLDSEPAPVFGAAPDAERALDALIENAIAYAGRGRVTVCVRGREIEVLDEGPGLAPGEEDAVFERFHRGYAGRAGGRGTGLGLSIARQLAERWGGDVTLANRDDGQGARAVLRLGAPSRKGVAS
ncbi:MAG: ATP-binding protein [Thermoleophilaceae bacterium]